VAAFAPAAGANFDFDALLHQASDAEADDDLGHYDIEPVIDYLPSESPTAQSTASLPISPPLVSSSTTPFVPSRHAPPKPGTAESAYRKAKGKAREKVKAQQRKDAASYGDFAVKPRLVNKHIKKPGTAMHTSFNAADLPHASTAYLGMRDSGGSGRVFQLEEVVGEGSEFGFELRKWDGRCVTNPLH
jgi:hypothetical protein